MIEIAQNFHASICSAITQEEKHRILNDFQNYYNSLSEKQKLKIQPFFAQIKLSIQENFQKLDALTEKLEKKYNMKFSEIGRFAESL